MSTETIVIRLPEEELAVSRVAALLELFSAAYMGNALLPDANALVRRGVFQLVETAQADLVLLNEVAKRRPRQAGKAS